MFVSSPSSQVRCARAKLPSMWVVMVVRLQDEGWVDEEAEKNGGFFKNLFGKKEAPKKATKKSAKKSTKKRN